MAKECSFTYCLDHEGFTAHQTPGLVIIRRVSCEPVLQSILSGPSSLKVQTPGMFACAVSVREESSNVLQLIDKKL